MTRQCEALTARGRRHGRRCRNNAEAYGRVESADGVREYLTCRCHQEAIRLGLFRPAVTRPVSSTPTA